MEDKQKESVQDEITWEACMNRLKEEYKEDLISLLEENFSQFPTKVQNDMIKSFIKKTNNSEYSQQCYFLQAPGGSGKTLAYCLPALIHLLKQKDLNFENCYKVSSVRKQGKNQTSYVYYPQIVILADTKVLIEQINDVLYDILPKQYQKQIHITTMYAGKTNIDQCGGKFGQILICNPAILGTMMQEGKQDNIFIDKAELLIMDEAENLYRDNVNSINKIIEKVKQYKQQQFISVSATLTKEFKVTVADVFYGYKNSVMDAIQITIPISLEGVQQFSCLMDGKDEKEMLNQTCLEIAELLVEQQQKQLNSQVMIFLESVRHIDYLNDFLANFKGMENIEFDVIHGRLETKKDKDGRIVVDRVKNNKAITEKFHDFAQNKFKVLLCTDIMARGIDIANVGLVINVFVPRILNKNNQNESKLDGFTYMHRIARTGRYTKYGITLTFFRGNQSNYIIKDQEIEHNLLNEVKNLMDEDVKFDNKIIAVQKGNYRENILKLASECVLKNNQSQKEQ